MTGGRSVRLIDLTPFTGFGGVRWFETAPGGPVSTAPEGRPMQQKLIELAVGFVFVSV